MPGAQGPNPTPPTVAIQTAGEGLSEGAGEGRSRPETSCEEPGFDADPTGAELEEVVEPVLALAEKEEALSAAGVPSSAAFNVP